MRNMFMILVLLMPSVASADMFKCISPKGSVTYSDSPCTSNNKSSTKLSIENAPQPPQRGGKPSWETEHDKTIMNHIRMGELDVAERLAVTSNQMGMVIKAKNLKILESVARNSKDMKYRGDVGENSDDTQKHRVDRGLNTDSANRDWDVRMKAKRDYQKQKIPGFITHPPTDAHESGVYKQEMNRQKNMEPVSW